MLQIGYFSSAIGPQEATVVHKILVEARKANRRDMITGLLIAGGGRYLQIIEGPPSAVTALYDKIRLDGRHMAVATFLKREINERSFGSWSMAFRRPTLAWGPDIFNHVLKALTGEIVDPMLKAQVRYFVGAMITDHGLDLKAQGRRAA